MTATPMTTPSEKKNEFIFHLQIPQLSTSVQGDYRSQNLLKLNMLYQRLTPIGDTKN